MMVSLCLETFVRGMSGRQCRHWVSARRQSWAAAGQCRLADTVAVWDRGSARGCVRFSSQRWPDRAALWLVGGLSVLLMLLAVDVPAFGRRAGVCGS